MKQHGGDIYGEKIIRLDFSVNTNPKGMPVSVRRAVHESEAAWERYPDVAGRRLKRSAAAFYRGEGLTLSPQFFLFGNGASDLLFSLVYALRPKRALLTAPSFSEYETALMAAGTSVERIFLHPQTDFSVENEEEQFFSALCSKEPPDLLILTNPNNPTGRKISLSWLRHLAEKCRETGTLLLVDECFGWFLENRKEISLLPLLSADPEGFSHVVVLNAMTKIFSMAGLRLGFLVCTDSMLVRKLEEVRQPWSVSAPAEAAGLAAFREREFIDQSAAFVMREREILAAGLKQLGFAVYSSDANYLLFRKEEGDPVDYYDACLSRGILIRRCANFYGLSDAYYRAAVRTEKENQILLSCLNEACLERKRRY